MKFTEASLEAAIIQLLEQQDFPHVLGGTLMRDPSEVLIKGDLRQFLQSQYANDGITVSEIESILRSLESKPASDLYDSNKSIMKMVSNGFLLKREDHNQKENLPI